MTTDPKPLTPAELDAIEARANAVNTRGYHPSDVEESQADVPRLVAEVRRLREALERIAIGAYEKVGSPLDRGYCDALCGEIAEEALGPGFCAT